MVDLITMGAYMFVGVVADLVATGLAGLVLMIYTSVDIFTS